MNSVLIGFSIAFFVLVIPAIVLTCIFDYKQKMLLKTICKGIASLCIVIGCIFAITSDNLGITTTKLLFLFATICALLGDIFLSEFASGKTKDIFTALGLLAFVATHLLYISAFLTSASHISKYLVFAPVVGLIAIITLVVVKIIKCPNVITTVGVVIYSVIAFLMVGSAANAVDYGGVPYPALATFGALIFLLSDIILSIMNFNEKAKAQRKILYPILLVLYYIGEMFIVFSLVMWSWIK